MICGTLLAQEAHGALKLKSSMRPAVLGVPSEQQVLERGWLEQLRHAAGTNLKYYEQFSLLSCLCVGPVPEMKYLSIYNGDLCCKPVM